MEAVIQTTSQEEIEQAAACEDVSIISVVGKTVEEAADLRQHIPERVRLSWDITNSTTNSTRYLLLSILRSVRVFLTGEKMFCRKRKGRVFRRQRERDRIAIS